MDQSDCRECSHQNLKGQQLPGSSLLEMKIFPQEPNCKSICDSRQARRGGGRAPVQPGAGGGPGRLRRGGRGCAREAAPARPSRSSAATRPRRWRWPWPSSGRKRRRHVIRLEECVLQRHGAAQRVKAGNPRPDWALALGHDRAPRTQKELLATDLRQGGEIVAEGEALLGHPNMQPHLPRKRRSSGSEGVQTCWRRLPGMVRAPSNCNIGWTRSLVHPTWKMHKNFFPLRFRKRETTFDSQFLFSFSKMCMGLDKLEHELICK
ncbi:uncharacterized protein [Narcine bancroftii]|uniref:uncharacterized protein n=1 Tax=Narcine bancroftii TaxID=1343680 RepID=UPI00383207DB